MRKPRALISVALAWGACWGAVALGVALAEFSSVAASVGLRRAVLGAILGQTLAGAVFGIACGAGFALLLAAFSRAGRFERLGYVQVACYGAISTGWLALLYADVVLGSVVAASPALIPAVALVFGSLGGVSSVVTLYLARRPDRRQLRAGPQGELGPSS